MVFTYWDIGFTIDSTWDCVLLVFKGTILINTFLVYHISVVFVVLGSVGGSTGSYLLPSAVSMARGQILIVLSIKAGKSTQTER